MLRSILAVLAGLVIALITVWLFQFASMHAYPPPPILDPRDPPLLAGMPAGELALALAGWVVGALDGGLVAGLIARKPLPAGIVGTLAALCAMAVVTMVPHPMWLSLAGVLLPVPAALFGAWLVRGRKPAA
jgi:hypothetical protein